MTALSAMVFTLSWWLGLYLVVRDPRKPVLALAALGLASFAAVVALDAVRVTAHRAHRTAWASIEIYLVVVPGRRVVRGGTRTRPCRRSVAQPCR